MTRTEKDIILARIDTLRWSCSDTQLQAVLGLVYDLAGLIKPDDADELGFKTSNSPKENTIRKAQN